MWPFTPMFERVDDHDYEEEIPDGAISRPLAWLGSVFLGGASGQNPNVKRAPFL